MREFFQFFLFSNVFFLAWNFPTNSISLEACNQFGKKVAFTKIIACLKHLKVLKFFRDTFDKID